MIVLFLFFFGEASENVCVFIVWKISIFEFYQITRTNKNKNKNNQVNDYISISSLKQEETMESREREQLSRKENGMTQ